MKTPPPVPPPIVVEAKPNRRLARSGRPVARRREGPGLAIGLGVALVAVACLVAAFLVLDRLAPGGLDDVRRDAERNAAEAQADLAKFDELRRATDEAKARLDADR